ncbi:MAG: S8 family serine peptidase, partial [candidate division Zixibacteria bacterium]|nr:S8 family serine peptidase [candidate division Zixibacteria bacterium]
MLRKLLVIILSIFASTALFLPALAGEIDFALHEFLLQKSADEMTPVIVIMADRINTSEVIREMRTSRVSIEERHETLINDLRYRAESTQRAVIDKIQSLKAAGEVSEFTPLWISNIIGVTATYSAINEIASIPEVETIIYDAEIDLIEPVDEPKTGLSDDIQSVEIGLEAIRADEVWDMGITGEGVIVCHLDTGAEGEHPALAERWRGLDPRYSENPEWAWHDPLTSTDFPFDDSYHGTHTMGTICGADHNSGDTVGVAIGAEWICAG